MGGFIETVVVPAAAAVVLGFPPAGSPEGAEKVELGTVAVRLVALVAVGCAVVEAAVEVEVEGHSQDARQAFRSSSHAAAASAAAGSLALKIKA